MDKTVFKNFEEYWSYAKLLTTNQRNIILSSLTLKQRSNLEHSYHKGGWEDLVVRNEIDKLIDSVEKDAGINLIYNHCRIMDGNSIPIKKDTWIYICTLFGGYKEKHTKHIFCHIKTECLDKDNILLVKSK